MKMNRSTECLGFLLLGLMLWGLTADVSRADVLVSEFNGNDVNRFSDSGTPVSGGVSAGSGGLDAATGVTMGLDNNIYVSSRNTGQILEYNGTSGAYIGVFATLPQDPNPLGPGTVPAAPAVLRFAGDGTLYVSDSGNGSILHLSSTGTLINSTVSGLYFAGGIAFSPTNADLYVADFGAGLIYKYGYSPTTGYGTQTANPTAPFINMNDPSGTPPGPNPSLGGRTPNGMVVDSSGNVYVTDLFQNQVLKYDSSGALVGSPLTVNIPGQPIPPEEFPSNSPTGIAFARDGSLLVANQGYSEAEPKGTVISLDTSLGSQSTFASNLASSAWITLTPPTFAVGDMNGDGVVNNFDITGFELALVQPNLFLASNQTLTDFRFRGDANGDNSFDNFDIGSFEQLLVASPGAAVPEPSSLLLMALAAVAGIGVAARRRRAVGAAALD